MKALYLNKLPNGKLKDLANVALLGIGMQRVQRQIFAVGENRRENDAEHCFQLCLACWYVIETGQLNLHLDRVLLLCLSHDLPEIYAGDTCAHAGAKARARKKSLEAKAIKKLKREHRDWPGLGRAIEEYGEHQSPESKFVSAMDKLLPLLNIALDGGRDWVSRRLSLSELRRVADKRIPRTSPLYKPYQEWIKIVTLHGLTAI